MALNEETKKMLKSCIKESAENKPQEYMPSGNLGFDLALTDGLGIPVGSSVLIWSSPGVGKSTLFGDVCRRLLYQTESNGTPFKVLYLDTEGSNPLLNSLGLGEYMKKRTFFYVDKPMLDWDTVSSFYDAVLSDYDELKDVKIIIIDSITNVLSKANLDKTGSEGDFGSRAKERYFFYSKFLMRCKERGITSFFISQARNNKDAGPYGDPDKAAVANGDMHAVDIILKCSKVVNKGEIKAVSVDTNFGGSVKAIEKYILKMDSQTGKGKNRFWNGLPAETVIFRGECCDNTYTLRSLLLGAGYIKQSGAWYSIDEEVCKLLKVEPVKRQMKVLNQVIKDNAGILFDLLKKSDNFHVISKNAPATEIDVEPESEEE